MANAIFFPPFGEPTSPPSPPQSVGPPPLPPFFEPPSPPFFARPPPTSTRTIMRVDSSGISQVIEDKNSITSRSYLLPRYLRLFDPVFVHRPAILGSDKAIFLNIEQIRCVITAEEVLIVKSHDANTNRYEEALQRMLQGQVSRSEGEVDLGNMFGNVTNDYLPFEFRVLEVALTTVCTALGYQATELSLNEVNPFLDELVKDISHSNLERVRRSKIKLLELTQRAQKVRDAIEQLIDDDGKMSEMYLTEKKRRLESSSSEDQYVLANKATDNTEELAMLLRVHSADCDRTLKNLTSLKEYIEDLEVVINMKLDSDRNKFLRFELFITTASFVIAIVGVVTGIFGMNFQIPLFQNQGAFKLVLIITGICGAIIYCWLVCYFKFKILLHR